MRFNIYPTLRNQQVLVRYRHYTTVEGYDAVDEIFETKTVYNVRESFLRNGKQRQTGEIRKRGITLYVQRSDVSDYWYPLPPVVIEGENDERTRD